MSESRFIAAKDGLRLHALDYGDRHSSRLPVVCLPGLTRTVEDFAVLAAALANERRVLSLDYRGRGRSRIALCREGGDGADGVGLRKQRRVALVGDHEHLHVGTAYAHRRHGRAAQDIGIGAVHDHQRHLRHGVKLRPQRRKRLVGIEAKV